MQQSWNKSYDNEAMVCVLLLHTIFCMKAESGENMQTQSKEILSI